MAVTIPAGDAYRPRSYQVEMFEASLKENIIVTMGTGSGKTHIALLRIMRELEGNPNKLIWFLTPTVALCLQQFKIISEGIPAVRSRTLTSLDKVELWREKAIWDAILKDMQVVVSTHAVLADAMSHGFVKITQLGLMIFDEAHHCMRRHPANKIMQDFYHPALERYGSEAVPKILGLTASPVVRSTRQELLKIESNLDAVCKTPRVHRSELLTHTHRPHLQQIVFTSVQLDDPQAGSETLRALVRAWNSLSIEDDPYIKKLRRSPLDGRALQRALSSEKTYCNEQLKRFVSRSIHIFEELGEWAADYFIQASAEQLKARAKDSVNTSGWTDEEKAYLLDIVSRLPAPNINLTSSNPSDFRVSAKFESLLAFLDAKGEPQFSGLIFAKQRATVSVMEKLLSVHPLTRNRFRCAAYVGWSGGGSKDVLGELLDARMQRDTLSEFRTGQKNLIVATDVLEEGIDISACSVVVCYDKPPNLKSFVQRRGRARHRESTYAIMFAADDESSELSKWQDLEKAMIEAYEDDERRLREAWALESLNEEVADRFEVESTGAVLTADTAVAHLNHFCAILPCQPYVENDAEYSFEKDDADLLRGTVMLPSCVHPAVRRTQGQRWWKTERAARKEAAFQTYKALYEFGLLSDHLLPFKRNIELKASDFSSLPALIEVWEQYDPWVDWACSWSSPDVHQTRLAVQLNGNTRMFMRLTTPVGLPPVEPMTLFWDSETIFTLAFDTAERVTGIAAESIDHMRLATALYLQATSSRQVGSDQDYVTLFAPDLPHLELSGWLDQYAGYDSALDVYTRKDFPAIMGIVRDRSRYSEPMLFRRWVVSGEEDTAVVELECDPVPRRRNLLQRQTLATKQADAEASEPSSKMRVILADRCTIDRLSYSETIFGRFISAIIDRLEATLVATRLCETILKNIKFSTIRHVITAITAPSAQSPTNYQRYEFFGDSVLKFTVSCQLFFQHPNWHEGYLSEGRDEIVQNPRLARAALDAGLDAFIMTKMFTPRKWNAPLISEKISVTPRRRMMSMKVLADVVEALIGAAYIDGGFAAAHECICRFLPEVNLEHIHKTENLVPKGDVTNHTLNDEKLMERIGYTFTDPSFLVEALTHPSCQFDATTQSYQRLEFLGDAVLDMVIMSTLLDHPTEITQGDMTKIKHAVVNANLLAFFCMEFTLVEERTNIGIASTGGITLESSSEQVELWRFMRYQGQHLTTARDLTITRHRALRASIIHDLEHSPIYPWQTLSQLSADKFFSDLIESILGAIFIDSRGNLAECIKFVERIGLLWYLRRILTDGVNVIHPRNTAQQMAKGDIQFEAKRVPNEQDDGATYRCAVKMAGVEGVAVLVEGCLTSEEAEITASNQAVEILTQRGYSL
ncbi:ATP-dependent helicase dcl2-1 [Aspergillus sclerotioniger CBS 115572]|uniref:ATP-dependent helicase dcl2-1 n=1 Tax=Aspergillus sclerotioniger CBS 115572 TaxID=1450535 RepID=A0A317XAJ6_9EURO|nr:ATP-dependent helicase dcl2-1 [Aspergillus sclerotioniger CBS 115572]PWY93978.1 ATP-dependent helicase dcl2-1 [Aspergillus sclerotioniger CBS 115572]